MIGIENRDSSFFTIESDDINLEKSDFSRDLISLSVTEKTNAMPQGTLQFNDPNHIYSRILRTAARLKISWGYKTRFFTPDSLLPKKYNLDEVSGSLTRRGLEGFISSPKGAGDNQGRITYNCNFTSFGFRGTKFSKTYVQGTKAGVIRSVFDEIGISPAKRKISFSKGEENLDSTHYVRQDETSYRFLVKLAKEWRTLFYTGYAATGEMYGVFIDHINIKELETIKWLSDATGKSHFLGYMGEINNVKSYTWSSNEGESGIGDNVKLDIVDGQIIFRQFIAEEESVQVWVLKPERVQKIYEEAVDFVSMTRLATELGSVKTFEEIKHFFDPVDSTTAPQGYGYRVNCQMIGNPLFCPPNQVVLHNGFPDRITDNKNTIFYLNTVTHIINKIGYNMTVEIIDVFNLSPLGIRIV